MRSVARQAVLAVLTAAGYASARLTLTRDLGLEGVEALAYPSMALGPWFGGVGPGMVTTILCALTGVMTRVYPDLPGPETTWASLVVLLFTGPLAAAMIGRARRSEDRAALALRSLAQEMR